MKTLRTALCILVATMSFSACQYAIPQSRNIDPPVRGIGLGFETITLEPSALEDLSQHIEAAGINTLYASVGRIDWTAFPWPDHSDAWSQSVAATQIDYLQLRSPTPN